MGESKEIRSRFTFQGPGLQIKSGHRNRILSKPTYRTAAGENFAAVVLNSKIPVSPTAVDFGYVNNPVVDPLTALWSDL